MSVGRMLPSVLKKTSASRTTLFSVLNSPARTRPCQRLTPALADRGPRLGVEVVADLLLPAGLSPAALTPVSLAHLQ